MIRDETKRVRQPAAWLLLGGVTISVFLGLMAMLSNGWAAGVNPATLVAVAAGSVTGPTFADRSAVASHVFVGIPVTAMAVAAVALATHLGERVRQAHRITLFAVVLQAVALFLGVITWLVSLGVPHGTAKLAFLLDGAAGIMVACAGLFFGLVTLRSREMQAARAQGAGQAGPQQSAAYHGYGYGQQGGVGAAHGYSPAGYQPGPAPQGGTAQQPAVQQYHADQPYGAAAAQHYGQAQAGYGQRSYGSYRQQAYPAGPAGYPQPGYDAGYGQQPSYGQGYGSYPQSRYGHQVPAGAYPQPGAEAYPHVGTDAYAQPGAETYQQYYQQHDRQAAEPGAVDSSQPGHGPDDGDTRELR